MNVKNDAHFNSPSSQIVVAHVFSPTERIGELKGSKGNQKGGNGKNGMGCDATLSSVMFVFMTKVSCISRTLRDEDMGIS